MRIDASLSPITTDHHEELVSASSCINTSFKKEGNIGVSSVMHHKVWYFALHHAERSLSYAIKSKEPIKRTHAIWCGIDICMHEILKTCHLHPLLMRRILQVCWEHRILHTSDPENQMKSLIRKEHSKPLRTLFLSSLWSGFRLHMQHSVSHAKEPENLLSCPYMMHNYMSNELHQCMQ